MEGFGIFNQSNGNRFEGEFKNGFQMDMELNIPKVVTYIKALGKMIIQKDSLSSKKTIMFYLEVIEKMINQKDLVYII